MSWWFQLINKPSNHEFHQTSSNRKSFLKISKYQKQHFEIFSDSTGSFFCSPLNIYWGPKTKGSRIRMDPSSKAVELYRGTIQENHTPCFVPYRIRAHTFWRKAKLLSWSLAYKNPPESANGVGGGQGFELVVGWHYGENRPLLGKCMVVE